METSSQASQRSATTALQNESKSIDSFHIEDSRLWNQFADYIPRRPSPTGTYTKEEIIGALPSLAYLFREAWFSNTKTFVGTLVESFAGATREDPAWRSLFGISSPSNDISILVFACHALQECSSRHSSCLRNLLRLVANCSADNAVNRRDVLNYGIIGTLLDVAVNGHELDTLIPTIYNICREPDDLASDEGVLDGIAQASSDLDQPDNVVTIPYPVKQLARARKERYGLATFELLLSLTTKCSEDRRPYLAALVEMAALPATMSLSEVLPGEAEVAQWNWQYRKSGQDFNVLEDANTLADESSECRAHVLRAILSLLSQEDARKTLFLSGYDQIVRLVRLASSPIGADLTEPDESDEELVEHRKQFLKIFYGLTGMSEFTVDTGAAKAMATQCTLASQSREASEALYGQPESPYQKVCNQIMLAQLVISREVCEQVLDAPGLTDMLAVSLSSNHDADLVYPTVNMISRMALSLSERKQLPFIHRSILEPMRDLLNRKGQGLIVPFETVHAFAAMLRGRPECLPLFVEPLSSSQPTSESTSIVQSLITLFEHTIEAGTKREVGVFFTELLRTTFPITKDIDKLDQSSLNPAMNKLSVYDHQKPQSLSASSTPIKEATLTDTQPPDSDTNSDTTDPSRRKILTSFLTLLSPVPSKLLLQSIAKILLWTITSSEPPSSRPQGWFPLALLSTYQSGRHAILSHLHSVFSTLDPSSSTEEKEGFENALNLVLTSENIGENTTGNASDGERPEKKNLRLLVGLLASSSSSDSHTIDKMELNKSLKIRLNETATKLGLSHVEF